MSNADKSFFCGIDPGKTGGLSLIRDDGDFEASFKMPLLTSKDLDINKIYSILEKYKIKFLAIEKAQAFPGQGVCSMFNYGKNYGILLSIISILKIPYIEVNPHIWIRRLVGLNKMLSSKKRKDRKKEIKNNIKLFIIKRFPIISSKTLSEGEVDATAIAEFARLYFIQK